MKLSTGELPMDKKQAKRLGNFLRAQRQAKGWSTHRLADESDQTQATVVRYEQGEFASPSPERLSRLAEALAVPVSDVLGMAGYPMSRALPSVRPYLRAKYRDLSDEALEDLSRDVQRVLTKHGIDPNDGPAAGEDEQPERSKAKASRSPSKKGGKK
jgi:transcriptional regulator with XRE-family HTH domain